MTLVQGDLVLTDGLTLGGVGDPEPGLGRQAALYAAMEEIHANHLGVYADVVQPGTITRGDVVELG